MSDKRKSFAVPKEWLSTIMERHENGELNKKNLSDIFLSIGSLHLYGIDPCPSTPQCVKDAFNDFKDSFMGLSKNG